jgi:putative ABC transport system ATP-binding protein
VNNDVLIEWSDVARTYEGTVPVDALRPTSLGIAESEYVAVVGPSGSGKSTFLNILGLLDRPTSGTYWLAGIDIAGLPEGVRTSLRAHFLGFVFQAFHLLSHLNVRENVELGMLYAGTTPNLQRSRALEVLSQVGMTHRRDVSPATLSGGERQRVAIARALAAEPKVLLCDEPTGNLDSRNAAQILDLLDDLNAQRTAIVVVTHDPVVADRARRKLVMSDGRVVADSASESLGV